MLETILTTLVDNWFTVDPDEVHEPRLWFPIDELKSEIHRRKQANAKDAKMTNQRREDERLTEIDRQMKKNVDVLVREKQIGAMALWCYRD